MKNYLLFALLFATTMAATQTVHDFEDFGLAEGEFVNDAPGDTFTTGNISLFNDYNTAGGFWQGWAISATTDTSTPGFMNQYSSASGGGANSSATYALTYAFAEQRIQLSGAAAGAPVNGLFVNNGTFAYLNMLNGGAPGKRFGGETGDDPDFFLLTIKGERNGEATTDSVNFYLADYRFADNSQDYIVTDWTFVDLQSLGNIDAIIFSLSSSDIGEFGMNTPAYVFVDDIITSDMPLSVSNQRLGWNMKTYPNPARDYLQIELPAATTGRANIFNSQGQLVQSISLTSLRNTIDVAALASGNYTLQFISPEGWNVQRFTKF